MTDIKENIPFLKSDDTLKTDFDSLKDVMIEPTIIEISKWPELTLCQVNINQKPA